MTDNTQQAILTGSQVQLRDGNVLDLGTITGRNYTQYNRDFSADEQTRAANLATFVKNYEQTLELTPTDMQAMTSAAVGAIPEYIRLQQQGVEFLERSTDGGVQLLRTLIAQDPTVAATVRDVQNNGMVATARDFHTIQRAFGQAVEGAGGAINFVLSFPGAMSAFASTRVDALLGGPSDARSNAFATAYVLAEREATRRGAAEPEITQRAANILDQVSAFFQAAFTQFAVVEQAVSFLTNGNFSGAGWQEAGEQVATRRAERAEAAGGTGFNANREYFLNKSTTTRTERSAQTTALDIVASAGEIAGIEATGVAAILRNGGSYLGQDNLVYRISSITEDATLRPEAVINPSTGEQSDRGDVLADNVNLPNPFVNAQGDPDLANITGAAAAVGGTAWTANKLGIPRRVAGAAGAVGGFPGREAGRIGDAILDVRTTPGATTVSPRAAAIIDGTGPRVGGAVRSVNLGAQNVGNITKAAAPILRRAGYVGVAIGAVGDGTEMVQAIGDGDTAGIAVNGAEVVGGAAGGVGGALGGGALGGWAGAGVGTVVSGVVGFFTGGTGLVAAPAIIGGCSAAGTAIGSVLGGWGGYEGGRIVAGGGTRLIVGEPEAERLAREQAAAVVRAGGAPITGGVDTSGPDGAPLTVGAPIVARLATI